MNLDNEICYTIEVTVKVIPSHYHTITVDAIANNAVDAFAIARQVVTFIYQYDDDCITSENLISQKAVFRVK